MDNEETNEEECLDLEELEALLDKDDSEDDYEDQGLLTATSKSTEGSATWQRLKSLHVFSSSQI